MKLKHLALYLIILALAGGYYLYFEVYKHRHDQEKKAAAERVFTLEKDRITAVTLDRAPSIRLEKQGAQWWVTAPIHEPADLRAVDQLLGSVTSLTNSRTLDDPVTDPSLFAKPLRVHVQAGGKTHQLTLGALTPTKEFRYARSSTVPGIFLVRAADLSGIDQDLLAFRDKRLITVPFDQVDSLTIARPGKTFQLIKDAQGRWSLPGEARPVEPERAETLVHQICWQEATFFADGMAVKTAPAAIITLKTKQATQELKIWSVGKALFALSSIRPQVVEIDRTFLSSLAEAEHAVTGGS